MIRKYSILAISLLISGGVFAQKDEFKTLKKIVDKGKVSAKDVIQYKAALVAVTPLVAATNEEDMIYLEFYKSGTLFIEMSEAMAKPENKNNPQVLLKFLTPAKIADFSKSADAVIGYEKKSGKEVFSSKIQEMFVTYKPSLMTYAISLGDQKRFGDAASVLHSVYQIDPTDPEKLYYAANYAVNAQDYTSALTYYLKLKDLNFSGDKINYIATSKLSDKPEYFASKEDRDRGVKIGTHTTPVDEKEPSKRGEIYKNIALILVSEGRTEEAKIAIQDARKANPEDTTLIMTEADIYLKTNDMKTYAKLINEVLEKDPKNADLVYNLGVVSGQNKDYKNAEMYYMKALEINPKFANAYYNLSAIRLEEGQLLLDQMNKLGTTAAENKKYDLLKNERVEILKAAVKLLEKTVSVDAENNEAKIVLLSAYKALDMKEKVKVLQAELDK